MGTIEFTNSTESQHVSHCYQQQTSTHCADKTPTGRSGDGFRDIDIEQKILSSTLAIWFTKQVMTMAVKYS